jgi:hypothetical protein
VKYLRLCSQMKTNLDSIVVVRWWRSLWDNVFELRIGQLARWELLSNISNFSFRDVMS